MTLSTDLQGHDRHIVCVCWTFSLASLNWFNSNSINYIGNVLARASVKGRWVIAYETLALTIATVDWEYCASYQSITSNRINDIERKTTNRFSLLRTQSTERCIESAVLQLGINFIFSVTSSLRGVKYPMRQHLYHCHTRKLAATESRARDHKSMVVHIGHRTIPSISFGAFFPISILICLSGSF